MLGIYIGPSNDSQKEEKRSLNEYYFNFLNGATVHSYATINVVPFIQMRYIGLEIFMLRIS